MHRVVAVDLGATSGRVMVAEVDAAAERLDLAEVHRFPNGGVRADDGSLRWDVDRIWTEVLEGIRLAGLGGPVDAIGVDGWGVDYGLLDHDGGLLGAPFSHRDSRTDGVAARVVSEVGEQHLYDVTGIQQLPFNTLYQLVAGRDDLVAAATLLLVPDLLGYWLSGIAGAEVTNASTTQLLDARSRAWADDLAESVDLPVEVLPPLREPGSVIGTLLPEVALRVGLPEPTPVVAVGSHDTASAVVGVPADGRSFAYVSSGTWSLVGLELAEPVLSEAARAADFTNEAGVDGTVRFLRNVSGLWVLSECVREWGEDLHRLLVEAAALPSYGVIAIDDHRLTPPGDMPARVRLLAEEAGIEMPDAAGPLTRLVLDSLAAAYAHNVSVAAEIAGVHPEVVHVVGGGSENTLLCQLTADACGLPVVAGPKEAAALGNVLVQARTLGERVGTLGDMRALLRATQSLTTYEPR